MVCFGKMTEEVKAACFDAITRSFRQKDSDLASFEDRMLHITFDPANKLESTLVSESKLDEAAINSASSTHDHIFVLILALDKGETRSMKVVHVLKKCGGAGASPNRLLPMHNEQLQLKTAAIFTVTLESADIGDEP
ncbi:MAG: hypothetical protein MHMPM18_004136, partial [Marteilia pararefringens]